MQEKREIAERLILQMEQNAEVAPKLELTPENWLAEFGSSGQVDTPIGKVKMGENQYLKMQSKKRAAQFSMVKPTLTNPDVIIEKKSKLNGAERNTKLLFVKTFIDNAGQKRVFFENVTVKQDGLEVSVSSHIADKKAIAKELINGTIAYNKFANRSESYLPENLNGLPDIVPAQANFFNSKDNTIFSQSQVFEEKNAEKSTITPMLQQILHQTGAEEIKVNHQKTNKL